MCISLLQDAPVIFAGTGVSFMCHRKKWKFGQKLLCSLLALSLCVSTWGFSVSAEPDDVTVMDDRVSVLPAGGGGTGISCIR